MLLQKRTFFVDLLLSAWWVSWFGFIGGFLYVGVSELAIEFSRGAVSLTALSLLVVVPLSWLCFFIADSRAKERTPKVITALTIAGTSLAACTLFGIWFFVAKVAAASAITAVTYFVTCISLP